MDYAKAVMDTYHGKEVWLWIVPNRSLRPELTDSVCEEIGKYVRSIGHI